MNFRHPTLGGKARALILVALASQLGLAQAGPASKPARGAIDGLVTDTALVPLGEVTVSVVGLDASVVTGENGRFRILDLPSGKHSVLARRIGSEAVLAVIAVAAGETARISMVLTPVVTELKSVRVTASSASPKLQEFEKRRQFGEGQFLTGEQIAKRNVVAVQDLLAGGFRGIRVGSGGTILNGRFPITQPCPLDYYVDGIPRRDLPSPKEIAGIELYLGPATMPLQFKRPTGVKCGIVMIWLKDGSTP